MKVFKGILGVLMAIGICLIVSGAVKLIRLENRTENYKTVDGYYVDNEIYSEKHSIRLHRTQRTYALIYTYNVNGVDYTVKTDYGTQAIPQFGSVKEIKYNPENPAEAVIAGTNGGTTMIMVGLFFVLVPLVMFTALLMAEGKFDKLRFNMMDLVIGVVFLVLGAGMFYTIAEGFSVKALVMVAGPFGFIPIMFLLVGVLMIKRGIFPKEEAKGKKKRR